MNNNLNQDVRKRHVIPVDAEPTIIRPMRNPSPLFPGWGPKLLAIALAALSLELIPSHAMAKGRYFLMDVQRYVPSAAHRVPPGLSVQVRFLTATAAKSVIFKRFVPSAAMDRVIFHPLRRIPMATPYGYNQASGDVLQPRLPLPRLPIALPFNGEKIPGIRAAALRLKTPIDRKWGAGHTAGPG